MAEPGDRIEEIIAKLETMDDREISPDFDPLQIGRVNSAIADLIRAQADLKALCEYPMDRNREAILRKERIAETLMDVSWEIDSPDSRRDTWAAWHLMHSAIHVLRRHNRHSDEPEAG